MPPQRSSWGRNNPPHTLVARQARWWCWRAGNELALPLPASLEDMHGQRATAFRACCMRLARAAAPPVPRVGRKLLHLLGGPLAAGSVICAYLSGRMP